MKTKQLFTLLLLLLPFQFLAQQETDVEILLVRANITSSWKEIGVDSFIKHIQRNSHNVENQYYFSAVDAQIDYLTLVCGSDTTVSVTIGTSTIKVHLNKPPQYELNQFNGMYFYNLHPLLVDGPIAIIECVIKQILKQNITSTPIFFLQDTTALARQVRTLKNQFRLFGDRMLLEEDDDDAYIFFDMKQGESAGFYTEGKELCFYIVPELRGTQYVFRFNLLEPAANVTMLIVDEKETYKPFDRSLWESLLQFVDKQIASKVLKD